MEFLDQIKTKIVRKIRHIKIFSKNRRFSMAVKKVRCPDCKEKFEIDFHEYDLGDSLPCPECNIDLTVIYVNDKPKLKLVKELFLDDDSSDAFYAEEYEQV